MKSNNTSHPTTSLFSHLKFFLIFQIRLTSHTSVNVRNLNANWIASKNIMHSQSSHKNIPYMHSHNRGIIICTVPPDYAKSHSRLCHSLIPVQTCLSASGGDAGDLSFISVSRSLRPTDWLSVTACVSVRGGYLPCECRMNGITALFSVPMLHASLICFVKPWRILKDSDGTLQIQIILLCLGTALGIFPRPLHPLLIWCWKDMFLTYAFICLLSLLSFLWMHNVYTKIVDTSVSFDC